MGHWHADSLEDSIFNGRGYSGEMVTGFSELITTRRTNVIESKSNVNQVSALRNITATANGATITAANSEFKVSTDAQASSSATLDTAERGRYMPGDMAEAGIATRYATDPAGEQEAKWGYFDDNNGVYFGEDATGVFVATLRDGTETKVYQSSWNTDKLDGTGLSKLTLNTDEGNIYHMRFSWYGYGVIEFIVILADGEGRQRTCTVHRFSPTQQVSVLEPNLPLRATVSNGATAATQDLYVAGRQFNILGHHNPNSRHSSDYRLLRGSIGTTFVPLVSLRRKATWDGVGVKIDEWNIISDADAVVEVRLNGSLTGASWGTPTNYTANETAMESDIAATAITGGEILYAGLVKGGSVGNRTELSQSSLILQDFPSTQPISLCLRAITGTLTASAIFHTVEEW